MCLCSPSSIILYRSVVTLCSWKGNWHRTGHASRTQSGLSTYGLKGLRKPMPLSCMAPLPYASVDRGSVILILVFFLFHWLISLCSSSEFLWIVVAVFLQSATQLLLVFLCYYNLHWRKELSSVLPLCGPSVFDLGY